MKKIILLAILFSPLVSFAQPALQWAHSFGANSEDRGYKIAEDAAGNIYVAGLYDDTVDFDPGAGVTNLIAVAARDAFIQKSDAAGNLIWVKSVGGAATDVITDIAFDNTGNIYATGYYQAVADFDPGAGVYNMTPVGGLDAFVLKLDANGDFVWAAGFGSTGFENGSGITIDPWGNVIFCGYFTGTADFNPSISVTNNLTSLGANEIFVCKLSSNGDYIWAKQMGGAGNDIGFSIVCDGSGNVYSTGFFSGTGDFNPGAATAALASAGSDDIFISKLDSGGNYAWAKRIGGTGSDYGRSVGLDNLYNVYTTGYFQGNVDFDPGAGSFNQTSAGGRDAFISKLDSNGTFIWAKSIGATSQDEGYGMHVKPSGEVLCSGYFTGTVDFDPGAATYNVTASTAPASPDAFAMKLDSSGNFVFALGIGDTLSQYALGILEDASDNVYLTGYFFGSPDFDPGAGVYTLTSNGNTEIFVAKYNPNFTTGINNMDELNGGVLVYPNPAANEIRVQSLQFKVQRIEIFNMLGEKVLRSENQNTIDVSELSPGIYFVKMHGENQQRVAKFVKQ